MKRRDLSRSVWDGNRCHPPRCNEGSSGQLNPARSEDIPRTHVVLVHPDEKDTCHIRVPLYAVGNPAGWARKSHGPNLWHAFRHYPYCGCCWEAWRHFAKKAIVK